ncbi:MAG: formimidoylglutamase [Phycisphaerae bacterium]|nr:formimidoylglutamase [Phycisphaerae bacterium]
MQPPHTAHGTWPEIAPDRFALTIARTPEPPSHARIALLGLPDDLGVRMNNGRPGAAQGPTAFRAALARFGANWDAVHQRPLTPAVWDAGDVIPARGGDEKALAETHQRVTDACLALHRANLLVVCIGGGHDLTFPAVRAASQSARRPMGGVSIDPHLDVRETPGSGMAFRALIEHGHLDPASFTVLGAGRFANSDAHVQWLASRDGAIVPSELLQRDLLASLAAALRRAGESRFVSFDLDSLDAAYAPGVSAINPCGLTPSEAASLVRAVGADPRVTHFDLMELAPPHDEHARTARIAAFLFLSFLSGFTGRAE